MADLRSRVQQSLSGSYTLERELGGGGMSKVFVADEHRLSRLCQQPKVKPIRRLVAHLFFRARRALADAADLAARRVRAVRTSLSMAPRSWAGAASSGSVLARPISHSAVA